MSNGRNAPDLAHPSGFGAGDFEMLGEMSVEMNGKPPALSPNQGSQMALAGLGMALTTPIVRPRDHGWILNQIRAHAAANAQTYYYSWPVKNRRQGTVDTVEGPTIKLANDIARLYGNCFAGVIDVKDLGDYWEFVALFVDRESGFMMARSFRQRREQNIGMKDAERALDIVYQIGSSKAIRNVVTNALSTYVNFAMQEAKKNLSSWVENNKEKADRFIDDVCARHNLDISRIEAVVGKKRKEWLVNDTARVLVNLRSIEEGMASAQDVFPAAEHANEVYERRSAERKQELAEDDAPPANKPPAKKAAAKKAATKKAETDTETTASTTEGEDDESDETDTDEGEQTSADEETVADGAPQIPEFLNRPQPNDEGASDQDGLDFGE